MLKNRVQAQTLPLTSCVTSGPPFPFLSLVSWVPQASPHLQGGPQGFGEMGTHSRAQGTEPSLPKRAGWSQGARGGSRSSCFLIFRVTVSPATCSRWMASLSGRPLRLTLLMAKMRSPTWIAPVLWGGGGGTGQRVRVRHSGFQSEELPWGNQEPPGNTPGYPQGNGAAKSQQV